MSDFEEKLNAILSSPDTMAQVAALAQQLSGGGDSASPPPPEQPPSTGLFDEIDPSMIAKILPLLQELNSPANDQRSALLNALRPFLKPERQSKIDRALQTARMIQVGKKLLSHWGDRYV